MEKLAINRIQIFSLTVNNFPEKSGFQSNSISKSTITASDSVSATQFLVAAAVNSVSAN